MSDKQPKDELEEKVLETPEEVELPEDKEEEQDSPLEDVSEEAVTETHPCEDCQGDGKWDGVVCDVCKGSGKIFKDGVILTTTDGTFVAKNGKYEKVEEK